MDRKITENASKDKSELLIAAASSNPDCEMWSDLSIKSACPAGVVREIVQEEPW